MAAATSSFARRMTQATVAFGLLAITCGFIGYSRVPLGPADGVTYPSGIGRTIELLYLSLGMLGAGVRQTYGEPFIWGGRWFGVLFVFSAVIRALIPQLAAAHARWAVSRLRGHTVVIGLGEKGCAFVSDLARDKTLAVMDSQDIDRDLLLIQPGSYPVYKLTGDAITLVALSRLNVRHASRVLVCTGNDALNHRIAVQVLEAARGRSAGETLLELIVHFRDREFGQALMNGMDSTPTAEVRPFSLTTLSARALLARHPWLMGTDRIIGGPLHWLFVGWDDYAEALAVIGLKIGAGVLSGAPRISVFCASPQKNQARLAHRYPAAAEVLEAISFRESSALQAVTDEDLEQLTRSRRTVAFVFGMDDAESMAIAYRLRASIDRGQLLSVPIIVRLDRPENHPTGLRPLDQVWHLGRVVESFGSLRGTCTGEALRDWHERLAQRVHDSYREKQSGAGNVERPKGLTEWVDLPEEFREANRRMIDHLPAKLAAIGYLVRGEVPLPVVEPKLDMELRERVARLEHQSWLVEKRLEGWVYGECRDDRRRRHDRLVAFEDLDAEQRSKTDAFEQLMALSAADKRADPWLARWRDASRARGGGAFRERLIVLQADPADLQTQADSGLESALSEWCERVQAGSRLGAQGEEFWTMIMTDTGETVVQLALALGAHLSRLRRTPSRLPRHRLVIGLLTGVSSSPPNAALERFAHTREAGLELVMEFENLESMRARLVAIADDCLIWANAHETSVPALNPIPDSARLASLPGGRIHRLLTGSVAQVKS